MNEQIRELAEQAGIKVAIVSRVCGADLTEWQQEHLAEIEKFAELLVREFLEVVKQSDNECNDEWDYAERDLCGIIKQHFGVRE